MLKELVAYTCSKPQVSIFDVKTNRIGLSSFVHIYLQSEDKSSDDKVSNDRISDCSLLISAMSLVRRIHAVPTGSTLYQQGLRCTNRIYAVLSGSMLC